MLISPLYSVHKVSENHRCSDQKPEEIKYRLSINNLCFNHFFVMAPTIYTLLTRWPKTVPFMVYYMVVDLNRRDNISTILNKY